MGDTVVPEIFPTTYADEHFYYAADAALTPATGGKALFRGAVEAAFVTAVQPGDQMVFSRIRVRMTVVPMTGTYRFIHPYGEESIAADAGDPRGIFFTDDVGLTAGNFEEALTSRVGPFLVPSTTPGGAEMAALTAANPTPDTDPAHFGGAFTPTAYPGTGKAYLADPARVGPITGSIATQRGAPLGTFIDSTGAVRNHNIYRIEGPPGSAIGGRNPDGSTIDFLETADFTLTGRAFADAIPGRVSVDRASYAATATARRRDVYASGAQTTQGRLPTFPRPPVVLPQLSYFTAPCSADAAGNLLAPIGAIEVQMVSSGTSFFGETRPATIPAGVCVKDSAARNALGNIVPAFFNGTVVDEINVTQALFTSRRLQPGRRARQDPCRVEREGFHRGQRHNGRGRRCASAGDSHRGERLVQRPRGQRGAEPQRSRQRPRGRGRDHHPRVVAPARHRRHQRRIDHLHAEQQRQRR
ncbi:MAG: hypothetical protein E6J62_16620 [Deltaproteobacteria bacterium]|nr:MAG: hypothetical protein E6J62_16620 [Deltaproteobacteria bacterium]